MDIKISPLIWSHKRFLNASAGAKLAALYLLTNQRVSLLGYAEISERYFVFETGLEREALDEAFKALGKSFVRQGDTYWIRGFIQWQFGRGESLVRNNYARGLLRQMEGLSSPWVGLEILKEYPELTPSWQSRIAAKGLVTPSEGVTKPKRREEKRRDELSGEEQSQGGAGGQIPDGHQPASLALATAFCASLGAPADVAADFFDHYEANGWKQGGRSPIKSWQAAAKKWVRKWKRDGGDGKKSSGDAGPPPGYDSKQPHATTGGVEVS